MVQIVSDQARAGQPCHDAPSTATRARPMTRPVSFPIGTVWKVQSCPEFCIRWDLALPNGAVS